MTILEEAQNLVDGPRQAAYGSPYLDHTAVGFVWAGILSKWTQQTIGPIPAHLVSMMMVGVKVIREAGKHGHDNLVDVAGYAYCAALEVEEEILREGTRWAITPTLAVREDLPTQEDIERVARLLDQTKGAQTGERGVPPRSDRSSGGVDNAAGMPPTVSSKDDETPARNIRIEGNTVAPSEGKIFGMPPTAVSEVETLRNIARRLTVAIYHETTGPVAGRGDSPGLRWDDVDFLKSLAQRMEEALNPAEWITNICAMLTHPVGVHQHGAARYTRPAYENDDPRKKSV